MFSKNPLAPLAIACLLAAGPAWAADYTVGNIKISDPWTRATPAGSKVGGGFLTITNTGTEADRLMGGSAVISGLFELHEMTMIDGVMRMRAMKGLEIKPGETVTLRPGSYHVMFMDLKQQIKEGAPVKGTLVFERAGKVEVAFRVAPVGSPAPSEHGGAKKH